MISWIHIYTVGLDLTVVWLILSLDRFLIGDSTIVTVMIQKHIQIRTMLRSHDWNKTTLNTYSDDCVNVYHMLIYSVTHICCCNNFLLNNKYLTLLPNAFPGTGKKTKCHVQFLHCYNHVSSNNNLLVIVVDLKHICMGRIF